MERIHGILLAGVFVLGGCSHKLEAEDKEPTVDDTELTYCNGNQSFVVTGTGLSPMVVDGATDDPKIQLPDVCMVRIQDIDGEDVSDDDDVCLDEEDVQWVSKEEIRFAIDPNYGLLPGLYDVVIRNPDGTEAKGRVRIRVLPGEVLVFWSDPSVVYNGISTQGTIYGSNIGEVDSVAVRDSDREETELSFMPVGTRNNRVQATMPADLEAGTYDVVVSTADGCQAELLGGIEVTDTVDLEVTSIDPTFGFTEEATPVSIRGDGFLPIPRAYLNPSEVTEDTVASALSSLVITDETRLTSVVPEGLPAGAYDLIVVNPDGKVGILDSIPDSMADGAFIVTDAPPPVINNISPLYVDNSAPATVTIEGRDFDSPEVTMRCRTPDNDVVELDGDAAGDGTSSAFEATLPVDGLAQGTVCVVRVTNADGSYFEYSAVGVSNPASNLNPFSDGPDLITARRAPAVAAARATRAARFLYAIGGDDGSAGGAMRSVETASIDVFGEPGDWFAQPVRLPSARTLAGIARVGRFLYLVGGNDGDGPTDSVLRAQVLNPLDAPEIVDVAARRAESDEDAGIGEGIWYYRVSAIMDDDDPSNAGGETLASDPLAVTLPDTDDELVLTLFWDEVPGAKGYRIYRSPEGTETLDGVRLLAEVDGGTTTSYEDTTPAGALDGDPPLPLGATGVWMDMPSLNTMRESAGVAVARDPDDSSMWHIYAIGGRDAAPLNTWERLTVTQESGVQSVDAWVDGGANISSARFALSAYSVSHTEAAQVPMGTTFIYAAGGDGMGNTVSNVDVAEVAAGGDLVRPGTTTGGWDAVDGMNPARSGYAGVPGAGFLFAFGGAQDSASDSNASAEIDPGAFPELINWNNEGVRLQTDRIFAGSAVESAFIYIVGGTSGSGALASVERTVL